MILHSVVILPVGFAFVLTLIHLVFCFPPSYSIHTSFGSSLWLMTALHGALAAATFQILNKTVNKARESHWEMGLLRQLLRLQTIQNRKVSSTLPILSVSLRGVLCLHNKLAFTILCPKPLQCSRWPRWTRQLPSPQTPQQPQLPLLQRFPQRLVPTVRLHRPFQIGKRTS